ncbi:MAG TPA: tRNA dihydrouridine synthase DusB [Myxococcales bacterium]|nr:tRNA dihydrouridine synthase DusB [Myxococcales bacterium]
MSVGALSQDAPFAARGQPRGGAPAVGHPVQPVKLGPLTLANRYFLAPLAGVSDWPFRLLCREMGASIAHTEMISSHGLVHGGDQTLSYLERPASERPFAIQVFGHDPAVLAEGARVAVEKYGPIDAIDINMGCPVKKVCGHGAGAAMLKDAALVERTVRTVVDAVAPLPVTVKLRAGWDDEHRNAPVIAMACEQGGAVAVGLHPRTRAQMYRGRADWELIRRTKQSVKIAVWGSGDLFTADAARRMLQETGADAARIARGACGYPWIFRELLALERGESPPEVTLAEWRGTILRHVRMAIEDKQGKHRLARPEGAPRPRAFRPNGGHLHEDLAGREAELAAIRELRKHLLWYTRGRRGGLAFRRMAPELHTEDDVRRALDRFFPEDGSVPMEVRSEPESAREITADD